MALYEDGEYPFGPIKLKIIPLNQDLSTPLPLDFSAMTVLQALGGVGPFDFSGATATDAVPLTIKIGIVAETKTIDVSTGVGSVTEAAVTADELATAIDASAFTGITCAAETTTQGRIVVDVDTPGSDVYIQVYGEAALISLFGQGYGLQFRPITTQEVFPITPTQKDAEEIEQQTTNGKIIKIITDGFRQGFTSAMILTDKDTDLRAFMEGGVISTDGNEYEVPNSDSTKSYFAIEMVQALYSRGVNKEQDIVGYILNRFLTCSATYGEEGGGRDWQKAPWTITGTEYKAPGSFTIVGDQNFKKYTVAAWETFAWDSV